MFAIFWKELTVNFGYKVLNTVVNVIQIEFLQWHYIATSVAKVHLWTLELSSLIVKSSWCVWYFETEHSFLEYICLHVG